MSSYLVTGAAGFIGGALAKKFLDQGHQVVTIDNLSTGFKNAIPERTIFLEGNCQDEKIIEKLNDYRFDAIFHIAGQSSGEISFDNPVYDLQTNTQSTLMLLKYALKTNCKKFIYASTMSVYGDQPDIPVDENAIQKPKSFYGIGKIASEHYLRIYYEYGIATTALRLFNVYGPGQNMDNLRQGMVSIYLALAIKNKHILVKGSSDRFRDFVYIDDVVDAFVKCLNRESDKSKFEEINICTSRKTTIRQLLDYLLKELPFKSSVEFSGNTQGDMFGITGNRNKALSILGWEPNITLEQGIKNMVKWAIK